MAFLVSGKIEFLHLFAIKDEVTQVLYYLNNFRILLSHLEIQRSDV